MSALNITKNDIGREVRTRQGHIVTLEQTEIRGKKYFSYKHPIYNTLCVQSNGYFRQFPSESDFDVVEFWEASP
jgi:hypothetical protein